MRCAGVVLIVAACAPTLSPLSMLSMLSTPSHLPSKAAAPAGVARSPEGTLGLAEAVDLAARTDPRGAATTARRRVAELSRTDARLSAVPDVQGGLAYTTGFPGSGSDLQLRGMLGSPFFHHYVAGIDASWNVAELLREPHAARAADAEIDVADDDAGGVRREAALVVIDLFERTLVALETQAVLVAEHSARSRELDALRARVAAKSLAEAELLQVEAAVADLDAELATARADERSTRAALRAVIADDRALTAQPQFDQVASAGIPEVQGAAALRREAAEQRSLARLAWLPRLMLGASAGYANPDAGSEAGLYAVGVAVAVPFTWALRERVQREANAAAADARALESDAVVQQLAVRSAELDGAVVGLESALPAAEVSRHAAEQARDALVVRAGAGVVAQVEIEAAEIGVRRTQMRERMIRVHLDALRARRTALGSAPASN